MNVRNNLFLGLTTKIELTPNMSPNMFLSGRPRRDPDETPKDGLRLRHVGVSLWGNKMN